MSHHSSGSRPFGDLELELDALLEAMPTLADLAKRQTVGQERPRVFHALTKGNHKIYPMVHIPVFGARGVLWVGRLPGIHDVSVEVELEGVMDFGIGHVVCLLSEADHRQYVAEARSKLGDCFRLVEVADFGTPLQDEFFENEVTMAHDALELGKQVLVHCHAGCGRTGMFVSCLLVRMGEAPLPAIQRYRHLRACGPETPHQVAYVFRYACRLAEGVG